jgi:3-oxoacyl-[acyl-carrier protein] reductase
MPDRYQRIVTAPPGRFLARRLGLPVPPPLRRYRPGDPVAPGPVLIGGNGALHKPVAEILAAAGVELLPRDDDRPAALVFDASGIEDVAGLRALYDYVAPRIRSVRAGGRFIVLGLAPESLADPEAAIAQQALEGFVRSLGKEIRQGRTAHLVYGADSTGQGMESTLRFLLSAKSAYLSGQVFRLAATPTVPPTPDWEHPLAGKTALVTGAARGIGRAIAETLHRDGAHVVCLDLPADGELLEEVAAAVGGSALPLSITDPDGPDRLADLMAAGPGGVDVVVHNAGITRDRTLARMTAAEWDGVLDVNLAAQYRITRRLLDGGVLHADGRVVCLSSVTGIAGNLGQTNYAASKAGVIGLVRALAPALRERGATINAVAPGFIETRLTARMPLLVREVGRRANSLAQAGQPIDVAETVAWLAQPGSAALTGGTVRVCGQSLLGA